MASLRGGVQEHTTNNVITRKAVVDDAPETPAHQFVVRAFKHAIWGTPAPGETERKPRRRDLDTKRPVSSGGGREAQTPPKRLAHSRSTSALNSPTKGILLTPGTANNRRKSVSWLPKQHNDGARTSAHTHAQTIDIKPTPRHFPGHYPTPTSTKSLHPDTVQESKPRQTKHPKNIGPANTSDNMKTTTTTSATIMDHGHDCEAVAMLNKLKREFDEYRTLSKRQIVKLIAREKMAMNYARSQEVKVVAAQRLQEEAQQVRAKESLKRMALEQDIIKLRIMTKKELGDVDDLLEGMGLGNLDLAESTISNLQIAEAEQSQRGQADLQAGVDVGSVIAASAPQKSSHNPQRLANISSDVFLDTARADNLPTRRKRTNNHDDRESKDTAAGARDSPRRSARHPDIQKLYYDSSVSGGRPHLRGGGSTPFRRPQESHARSETSALPGQRDGSSPRKPLAETSGNEPQGRRDEPCDGNQSRGDSATAAAKQEKSRRAPQLPLDRLEAAKARIAQRNASKGKEAAGAA